MFDRTLKNTSVAALVVSCSLFSSLSYSDEICFVNLSNSVIETSWNNAPMMPLTKQGTNANCAGIEVTTGLVGTANTPSNDELTISVWNPAVGALDIYLGYQDITAMRGYGDLPHFWGMVLGTPATVSVTGAQKGGDGVYRIYFQDY